MQDGHAVVAQTLRGLDAFDVLLLHNPDRTGYTSEVVWDGLDALRDERFVLAVSVGVDGLVDPDGPAGLLPAAAAARLAEAGVRFAFTGNGLADMGEFLPAVRRAVDAGLARDRALPAVEIGDLLAIGKCGGYAYSRASAFNQRERPAEVLVDGSEVRLIRRREQPDDFLRGQ